MKIEFLKTSFQKIFFPMLALFCCTVLSAQEVNYDESKIPPYTLPDPLMMNNGKPVTTQKEWTQKRRPEIVALFERQMFGKAPEKPKNMHFKVLSEDKNALNGMATRKEVAVYFTKGDQSYMTVLIYLPNNRKAPVPLFVGLNFYGNYTVSDDPGITVTGNWVPNFGGIEDNKADVSLRGTAASRWPIDLLLERGYGLATIYSGDLDPDFHDGFQNGIHPLFYEKGQTEPKPDQWATIAAWAWGLSRAMDYFEQDKAINAKQVAIVGHSRLGKAALWAGATDERFAMVVSNNSGCGGAALSMRRIGETVAAINRQFPHWFCANFTKYNHNEDTLPMDQHELMALMAPRPLYIASAEKDLWADPKGEFLSGIHAGSVYALFGLSGLPTAEMPELNQPLTSGFIGYHIRTGEHDITRYDWEQYLNFADRHFK